MFLKNGAPGGAQYAGLGLSLVIRPASLLESFSCRVAWLRNSRSSSVSPVDPQDPFAVPDGGLNVVKVKWIRETASLSRRSAPPSSSIAERTLAVATGRYC